MLRQVHPHLVASRSSAHHPSQMSSARCDSQFSFSSRTSRQISSQSAADRDSGLGTMGSPPGPRTLGSALRTRRPQRQYPALCAQVAPERQPAVQDSGRPRPQSRRWEASAGSGRRRRRRQPRRPRSCHGRPRGGSSGRHSSLRSRDAHADSTLAASSPVGDADPGRRLQQTMQRLRQVAACWHWPRPTPRRAWSQQRQARPHAPGRWVSSRRGSQLAHRAMATSARPRTNTLAGQRPTHDRRRCVSTLSPTPRAGIRLCHGWVVRHSVSADAVGRMVPRSFFLR